MAEAIHTGELHGLMSAIHEWNAIGVRWCLLRDPDGPRDDIDILVDRRHFDRVRRSLSEADFLERPAEFHQADAHFIHHNPGGAGWTWVHLTSEISFGPYSVWKTGLEDLCLSRRCREGDWYRLPAQDEFWPMILHCLLDKGEISGRYCKLLPLLAAEPVSKSVFALKLTHAFPPGWDAEWIGALAREQRFRELEALGATLMKSLFGSATSRWLILRQKCRVAAKLRQKLQRRGPIVAICSPCPEARSIAKTLQESFVFPVTTVECASGRRLVLWLAALRASWSGSLVLMLGDPGRVLLWKGMPVAQMRYGEFRNFDAVAWVWSEYRRRWAACGRPPQ